MTRIMTTAAAALALAMSAAGASAQESSAFDLQTDDAGGVTQESFNAGFEGTGVFDAWDKNGDGNISRDEFNTGVYGAYDIDDDGYWTADEVAAMNSDRFWDPGTTRAKSEPQTNN